MKLPLPSFLSKKGASDNHYLALLLRDEKAVAVILKEEGGQLTTIGTSETFFSTLLQDVPYEELLDALDRTISKAEEKLPPNIETEKTVFGVKDSWVVDKKIDKEHLAVLKKLCDALTLTPIGFMVISEAIAHLLNREEGAPLSAVVAEIGKRQATISLFRAGKVLEAHTAPLSVDAATTVDKLLHHFTIDVLPSRIILFNGADDASLSQIFITHQWSKSIPFLHVPQISVLPDGFDGKAMIYGAAEQMGFAVSKEITDTKITTVSGNSGKPDAAETKVLDSDADSLSKAVEEDITKEPATIPTEAAAAIGVATTQAETIPTSGDNFGFVMDQDIGKLRPQVQDTSSVDTVSDSVQRPTNAFQPTLDGSEPINSGGSPSFISGALSMITSLPSKLMSIIPSGSGPLGLNKYILIGAAVLILIIGSGIWYAMTVKATVTLHVKTKAVDESTNVTFSLSDPNDFSEGVISAREVETELDGDVSTDASGKKSIGDKAKGTITLYNKNESKKTIPSGTVLKSSNNVEFVTDKEVAVASASGDISGTKAGTGQTTVTAKELGTDANLPSNTEFTVAGFSNVAGKNDSAFSGGTKKDVTVVSKKDTDKLLAELPKSLVSKAQDEIKSKISDDDGILPDFTTQEIVKKKFDNDVDDEAKKVTLSGTVSFSTYAYAKKDLTELAEIALKGQSSDDLALAKDDIEVTIEDIEVKDDVASATLSISGGLLPTIDQKELSSRLAGKSFADAAGIVKETPQITDADIVLSPNIPFIPKILPRIGKNITIVVSAHD